MTLTGSGDHVRPEFADLVIYDDVLPSPSSPFRTLEYGHYLDFFPSAFLVSTASWHFGFAHAGFGDLVATLPIRPDLRSRVLGMDDARDLIPRLAYVTFLGNAQRLLPYFESRRIPFILQLYPGGSFETHVQESDDQLRRVVHSSLCRKVIATQVLTRDYLLRHIGCEPSKVEMIYGGVFDSRVDFDFSRDKRRYGTHKDTIDVCFVAHRYGNDMTQKGYDQFVDVARRLALDARLRFHVVGDYTPDDLPLGEAAPQFTFHGVQASTFFADFYPSMDVILSANRPLAGREGPFDGFPTGACMEAGFRGVLNCITDPLGLNVAFEDGHDILLIDRDAGRTAERLSDLFSEPERLYELARANWQRFGEVFDVDHQLWARTRIIVGQLLRAESLISRPSAPLAPSEALTIATHQAQEAAADAGKRHDALLLEYQKLASGLEELRAYSAAQEKNLLAEIDRLQTALTQAALTQVQHAELARSGDQGLVNRTRMGRLADLRGRLRRGDL